jgi:hypothetical protein
MDIRIYAFPNSGWWYDLRLLIGAAGLFGSFVTAIPNEGSRVAEGKPERSESVEADPLPSSRLRIDSRHGTASWQDIVSSFGAACESASA